MAIRETLQGETLTSSICTVAVVGAGESFHILDQETVQKLIDSFEIAGGEEAPAAAPDSAAEGGAAAEQSGATDQGAADQGPAPMDI